MTWLFVRLSLMWALIVSPWLLATLWRPRGDGVARVAGAGLIALTLNTALPALMHAAGIPLTPLALAVGHWGLGLGLVLAALGFRVRIVPGSPGFGLAGAAMFFAFAVTVFPHTFLAGIDTYKWQDLATWAAVEQSVPWLTHPLAILGYAPRAYPAMQPLCLATIQILGETGVDGGFYIVSLLGGLTGLTGMFLLARRLTASDRLAGWSAFLYVFSPVFMRYNHWATGRGLFLAVFPALVLALTEPGRLRSRVRVLFAAAALLLTHRAALPAMLLLGTAWLAARVPWGWFAVKPTGRLTLALPFALVGMAISAPLALPFPLDRVLGFAARVAVQTGPMALPAAAGFLFADALWKEARWRCLMLFGLSAMALSGGTMYGALPALLPASLWAAHGLILVEKRCWPTWRPRLAGALAVLCAGAALATVVNRNRDAVPRRVRDAARFLNTFDPDGPYMLQAPERVRTGIQAYVTGCPRPDFGSLAATRPRLAPFPSGSWRHPRRTLDRWIAYGRRGAQVPDAVPGAYYGLNPKIYRIVVDAPEDAAVAGKRIYSGNGLDIFE